ncbi:MAG: hypothetical protein AAFP81_00395 [Pseudomonadota bacterium]
MKPHTLMASLAVAFAGTIAAPEARADCDITANDCFKNGKCNIKFRNMTAETSGSSSKTKLTQRSMAQIIRVKAAKDNGNSAGNILNIESGTSKTMNLGKKYNKDFAKIRISAPTSAVTDGVTMNCADVNKVLAGNGTCKVFYGFRTNANDTVVNQLGYRCDGGKVQGPAK